MFENDAESLSAWWTDLFRERDARYRRALASGQDSLEACAASEQPASKTLRCGARVTVKPKLMAPPEAVQRALRTFTDTAKSSE